jgi:PmbA/TldA metallopeptidase C-terminal domain
LRASLADLVQGLAASVPSRVEVEVFALSGIASSGNGSSESIELTTGLRRGLAVRAEADGRVGFAAASGVSAELGRELVRDAIGAARSSSAPASLPRLLGRGSSDPCLTEDACNTPATGAGDLASLAADLEGDVERTLHTMRAGARDARLLQSGVSTWRASVSMASTLGVRCSFVRAGAHAWMRTAYGTGRDMGVGFACWGGSALTDLDVSRLVGESTGRAQALAAPRPAPAGALELPLVFDRLATAQLLDAFSAFLTADARADGSHLLGVVPGTRVAQPQVRLVDEAERPDIPDAARFDDEGVPRKMLALIEDGMYLRDVGGRAEPRAGNAVRAVLVRPPRAGTRALRLTAQTLPVPDLLAAGPAVLHVLALGDIRMRGLDPGLSRQLRCGLRGVVRHGVDGPAYPFRELELGVDVGDIFRRVTAVGDDPAVQPLSRTSIGCSVLLEAGEATLA